MTLAFLRHPRQRGWFIPWLFVAAFLVVMTADGIMVYFATTTFTGLTTEHAYEEGVHHNQVLARLRAQEALGWQVELALTSEKTRQVQVRLRLLARDGVPVAGAAVTAHLRRPTSAGHDQYLSLVGGERGLYTGEAMVELPGLWDVQIEIVRGEDHWVGQERVQVEE